jgi:hypothetical protein
MSPQVTDGLDPTPFRSWCDSRLTDGEGRADEIGEAAARYTVTELAADLGVGERRLWRWRNDVVTIERCDLEDALHRAGSALWEVYGVEDVDLEAEAYCERCKDTVTPIGGLCPWCDSALLATRARRWCPREDRLVFPANNGSCWRCGTETESIPWADCACGCGRSVPRFDPQGRPHEYALGHNPPAIGKRHEVPVEAFAEYLEAELERMDLIGALARAHSIARDDVIRVLKRQDEVLPTSLVRRALWTAGRGGTGKGLPMRPDAVQLRDLYPDFVRSKVCPGCGEGKAPHAELCKACRTKRNRRDGITPPTVQTRIRGEVLAEALEHYREHGNMTEAARTVFDRTPHKSTASLVYALRREWKRAGADRELVSA